LVGRESHRIARPDLFANREPAPGELYSLRNVATRVSDSGEIVMKRCDGIPLIAIARRGCDEF
jgi:hypothetical protein